MCVFEVRSLFCVLLPLLFLLLPLQFDCMSVALRGLGGGVVSRSWGAGLCVALRQVYRQVRLRHSHNLVGGPGRRLGLDADYRSFYSCLWYHLYYI